MKRVSDAQQTAECSFCGREFKFRELKRHQQKCESKSKSKSKEMQRDDQAYKFMIGDTLVFEHILSFLGHQSLTKLQGITGDRYKACEPELARICCACENDMPALFYKRCSQCATAQGFKPTLNKYEAQMLYGLSLKNLSEVPSERPDRSCILYARADLDKHVLRVYGSQMAWLKRLAPRFARERKLDEDKMKRLNDFDAALRNHPKMFRLYAKDRLRGRMEASELQACNQRYSDLTSALSDRGLQLKSDSGHCMEYITTGRGQISEIVDVVEEIEFLFIRTNYSSRCFEEVKDYRKVKGTHFLPTNVEKRIMFEGKMKVCIDYLTDAKDLELPRKWENCRGRFDAIKAAGRDLSDIESIRYIYCGDSELITASNSQVLVQSCEGRVRMGFSCASQVAKSQSDVF